MKLWLNEDRLASIAGYSVLGIIPTIWLPAESLMQFPLAICALIGCACGLRTCWLRIQRRRRT